ncbi:MAG: sarcosine oxidase subunit gamma [Woeseiaceae bacterium]
MPDQGNNGVSIERIEDRSIVSLKVSRNSLDGVGDRLQLAAPLRASNGDPQSLWVGPDQWLLVSDAASPDAIIEHCRASLADVLHNAVDNSAGLAAFRIDGLGTRELLATGSGVDFRPAAFSAGRCCRTRFAGIAAIIVAQDSQQFEIYVDRSYEIYLSAWLSDSLKIAACAGAGGAG